MKIRQSGAMRWRSRSRHRSLAGTFLEASAGHISCLQMGLERAKASAAHGGGRWYAWSWLEAGSTRGRFHTRLDYARCALAAKAGNTYKIRFYYRRPGDTRACPFKDSPTSPPCPLSGALALGPSSLPFGYDAEPIFEPDTSPSVSLAASAPVFRMIYAWRRPHANFSAANDGYWGTFKVILTELQLNLATNWTLAEATTEAAPAGMNALSFGLQTDRMGATGRVQADLDDFSYCRCSGPAETPSCVPACGAPCAASTCP